MPSISNVDHDLYNWLLDPRTFTTFHEFGFLNPTQLIESLSKPKKKDLKRFERGNEHIKTKQINPRDEECETIKCKGMKTL
jgi:hypothetical protein